MKSQSLYGVPAVRASLIRAQSLHAHLTCQYTEKGKVIDFSKHHLSFKGVLKTCMCRSCCQAWWD